MSGYHFGSINISWQTANTLWIGYCSGRTYEYRNRWFDMSSDDPVEVAVILEQEAVSPCRRRMP